MKYVVLFNLSFIILFAFLFWQLYLIVFVKEQPEYDKCTLHKNNTDSTIYLQQIKWNKIKQSSC